VDDRILALSAKPAHPLGQAVVAGLGHRGHGRELAPAEQDAQPFDDERRIGPELLAADPRTR
jgi:hypothetical protein